MKIAVINGSPKGEQSISVQSLYYLEKKFPDTEFSFFNIAIMIKKLEKNKDYFQEIIDKISIVDGLVWVFPVYTMLVPYQLLRFIELVEEREALAPFNKKVVWSFSTSEHFFDHTAHDYIKAVSEDWGMFFVDMYSAQKDDLLVKNERQKLIKNFGFYLYAAKEKVYPNRSTSPIESKATQFFPSEILSTRKAEKDESIVIVTDAEDTHTNLDKMLDRFCQNLKAEPLIIKLQDLKMKGGCLGCLHCMLLGNCVYKDNLSHMHRTKIIPAKAIIYAGNIKGRFLSSIWKLYFDRLFYNGHNLSNQGTCLGFILCGDLHNNVNLQQFLIGQYEVGKQYNLGLVNDAIPSNIERELAAMVARLYYAIDNKLEKPQSFPGVGGVKVFRDLIYANRGLMLHDHRFYKKNGLYDFPNTDMANVVKQGFYRVLMSSEASKKAAYKEARAAMVKKHKRLVAETQLAKHTN